MSATINNMPRQSVVVVGGGIIGAVTAAHLALSLSSDQLAVTLVDGGPAPQPLTEDAPADVRVVALTAASVSLLKQANIWDRIPAQRRQKYQQMRVWDREGTGNIHFSAAEASLDELGWIVENAALNYAATQQLAEIGVRCLWNTSVERCFEDDQGVTVQLADGQQLHPDLLVAADGANSRIRDQLDIPVARASYEQQAIVATVESAESHSNTAYQSFLSSGPAALLPLPIQHGKHFESVVWSADNVEAERLMSLTETQFSAELGRVMENVCGKLTLASKRYSFPLQRTHARNYVGTGWVLLGDAAHTIHPLAGQGANLGFSDALVLAEELSKMLARGVPLSVPVKRYERRRKGDNQLTALSMSGFNWLFGNDNPTLRLARNWGLNRVDKQGLLKQWLLTQAQGR
ncbi:UbiH/UbiF/VisC/COQ6 family ubiquinone biosynthesis hydroxylase [uncultured Umboniibacter sp.]|uniref:UbiH/UbiF/VisC/COQ6 family ubiquinone biosynthesis hydroxylase n=1 Tax=uncultured Umboniibacter sp. TaxID=1798917 RepID=UPI002620A930|nr:UbiH/UbiF/VisC/COQ6 family ubiquinone biosynthesis hydroxylase [uncultured Umboniibacter sp.]